VKINLPLAISAALRFIFGLSDPSDPSRNKRTIFADSMLQIAALLCGTLTPFLVLHQIELAKLSTEIVSITSLLGVLFILGLAAIFYLLASLICLIRRQWVTLILAFPLGHFYLVERLLAHFFEIKDILPQPVVVPVLIALSGISLAWFSQSGRIFSRTFIAVFILVFNLVPGVVASLLLAMCLFLRFFLLALRQNIEVLRPIGWLGSGRLLSISLVYWIPMVLLAVPGYYWVDYSHRYSLAVMTCMVTDPQNNLMGEWAGDCVESEVHIDRSIADFREHTLKKTREFYEQKKSDINAWEKKTSAKNNKTLKTLRIGSVSLAAYDSVIPRRINALEPRDCKLLDLSCGAGNLARGSLRASYQGARNEQRSILKKSLGNKKITRKKQIETAADAMKKSVAAVREAHINALNATFIVLETLALICLITLLFVGLRSLLYVFARVAFGTDAKAYVSLRSDQEEMPHGKIRREGGECVIDLKLEGEFYAARKYQPQGQAPKFSLPQPGAVPLARIRHGAWGLNHLKHREGSPKVQFSTSQGQEFVVWELEADEIVVFDFKYFVAMSSSLRLFSIISLRISSLLFGKIIFPAVRGPGSLVLKSYGKPSQRKVDESIVVSIAPGRLLAWQKNTRFSIDSTLSFVDIYLSGFYMRPREVDLAVIDADRPGERESGLGRFVTNFLLPW